MLDMKNDSDDTTPPFTDDTTPPPTQIGSPAHNERDLVRKTQQLLPAISRHFQNFYLGQQEDENKRRLRLIAEPLVH